MKNEIKEKMNSIADRVENGNTSYEDGFIQLFEVVENYINSLPDELPEVGYTDSGSDLVMIELTCKSDTLLINPSEFSFGCNSNGTVSIVQNGKFEHGFLSFDNSYESVKSAMGNAGVKIIKPE